jgi:hypothetical protein
MQHACVPLAVHTPPMHSSRAWNGEQKLALPAVHGQPRAVGFVAQSGAPESGPGMHGPSLYSIHTPWQHWYVGVQQTKYSSSQQGPPGVGYA